ncbi:hypothetical protein AB205_0208380 [Aquarana catesbeiana]|uniref:Uncharacterized protein n=1 Tax=Aquarana catesbeiana TaxID=8400 RepID=A0A2G9S4K6_AQUCT|nr:hypothetical protein AB205_0208380 [Aquarana catesbeiana]
MNLKTELYRVMEEVELWVILKYTSTWTKKQNLELVDIVGFSLNRSIITKICHKNDLCRNNKSV